ncbi:RagB/SusD family nutrient uptake outer membrane protein [Fulvivirgaceae bacterium PWU5]|uniref:RagB/SusD family nutrient uptake outer membrane protein n=1 Tax=Dawidia cretensis TaxID=2782350 RepID=A0AAP2GVZ4_9BACT|nr:RagB/SusD family nutrient uptake outer membrane protein [Dawidia cretensis]MBT1711405.1 RagB/SusD family nutrient uptake outer membrane protein [Dawidia cretensis]
MKKIFYTTLVAGLLLTSCSDFLKEEMVATVTQQRYDTPEGIDELVNGGYEALRYHFNDEWSYVLTNYGTDEFTHGLSYATGTFTTQAYNTYTATLAPTEGYIGSFFDNLYAQINVCNIGIKKIPEVLPAGDLQNTRLGEVYFLRGFAYYKLVTQFGGVPRKLTPSETLTLEYTRATDEEIFAVVISDLRKSVDLLPTAVTQNGRIASYAAQHFLAKAYLTRASELYAGFSPETDLDSAIYYAEEVINNSSRKLAAEYSDIFKYTAVNGPNESNPEIILAAQFENTQTVLGRFGNRTHMFFLSDYRTYPGMTRDLANGREFNRLRPTDYTLDIFDRKNDSRFYKNFKTAYLAGYEPTLPRWTETDAPTPALVGKLKFNLGDTSIIYIANKKDDTRFTPEYKLHTPARLLVRYNSDGKTDFGNQVFLSLSKYIDPFRVSFSDDKGTRDGILARLSETYLIAAEAYGRKGDYTTALKYINDLRTRAAYKGGETRSNVYYLAEQVPFGETGGTAEDLQVTEASFTPGTPEAARELYPTGVGSMEAMFVHFILNERSRELLGEFHRWVDLARTNTLIVRARAFNMDAKANIRDFHIRRPIPQSYLDTNQKNGKPLTADEKAAEQNEGY